MCALLTFFSKDQMAKHQLYLYTYTVYDISYIRLYLQVNKYFFIFIFLIHWKCNLRHLTSSDMPTGPGHCGQ